MSVRKIYRLGDDVLRKKAHPVTTIDRRIIALLNDMADSMYAADGCGLAAPQVGILRRVVVIDIGEGLVELINPVLIEASGEDIGPEGCLSLPGKRGIVKRPARAVVRAVDRKGREIEVAGEGYMARALCHELDHLDGILYIDTMIEDVTGRDDEEGQKE